MHPIVMPELIWLEQAERVRDAERHRLAAVLRRSRGAVGPRHHPAHRRPWSLPW
jgi:hypothetical protein